MSQTAGLNYFFKDFLVRRMMIDHTFIFPRMIWTFASIVLIAFGYSSIIVILSYLLIYALYVFVAVINFISVGILLGKYPEECRFYLRRWWVTLTLPIYMFLCAWIRLIGVINAMTMKASWKMHGFNEEAHQFYTVIRSDVKMVKTLYRQRKRGN